jgi:hypothetical protein
MPIACCNGFFKISSNNSKRSQRQNKPKTREKVVVFEKDGTINLIPRRHMTEMRGFAKGVTAKDIREEEPSFW